ncbi:Gfo/Idh/MocA family protein [Rhizobium sp. SSA_523]|uniref:Gfo/Idh/MocA family protein n=1 Tax=Rhizobium sp. SSA_523 TaxID=2952477 RepID=UPI0020911167|nr:Gfo/Idh/MocA family oxidoreductase [Rhizobium sp. SSA_523]MCO5733272.1 Gfo/Idh/MocA family oxidoreductase [Rhizobium sp. SSA_523]WKC21742.1 Gfo/Idh/MocA family oxidoreductase [Rhizobium sp. SSA_523]
MNTMVMKSDLQTETRPIRLGFLGVGWIGRNRMQAVLDTGVAQAVAIADPNPAMLEEACRLAPQARVVDGLDAMLREDLDGVVIATPNARHAAESIRVLESGRAVFCQKPLGRTEQEVQAVVDAARSADRLLAVDLSYRFTEGMQKIRDLIRSGALGSIYAADLTFHNAYGPDKPWFYEKSLSGGGCVIDLGVHLVDAALWSLGFPAASAVSSRLMSGGQAISGDSDKIEDYAVATIDLESGATVRLACSWRLPAGQDAVISAAFYGTEGGAQLTNINGSFYDFRAEHLKGTTREELAGPPDAWGGRAAADWARRLSQGATYDAEADRLVDVANVLDRIYGRGLGV